ncbi:MAG: hypothetical protein HY708_01110 [Ignavibacteriae bacterium]|nr:hypothetical protein [Ignavibacteriota bacterium]
MGRITSYVTVENLVDPSKKIQFDGFVDTGASMMVLPAAWRERLGKLESVQTVDPELANQKRVTGEICGPVRIRLEGFRPVFTEVVFLDMKPENGTYEPLIGYTVLELSMAAVDMVGHRLVHTKKMDLKRLTAGV